MAKYEIQILYTYLVYIVCDLSHAMQGILESSIKITNEPPTGMLANLHKALDNFNQVYI